MTPHIAGQIQHSLREFSWITQADWKKNTRQLECPIILVYIADTLDKDPSSSASAWCPTLFNTLRRTLYLLIIPFPMPDLCTSCLPGECAGFYRIYPSVSTQCCVFDLFSDKILCTRIRTVYVGTLNRTILPRKNPLSQYFHREVAFRRRDAFDSWV